MAYVLTLLSGKARDWGMAVWKAEDPCCASFDEFSQEMSRLFDQTARGDEAAARLSRLTQGKSSITDFSIRFKTLAASCDWNEGVLRARFLEGLSPAIANELAALEMPHTLEEVINLSLRVDSRLSLRRQLRMSPNPWRLSGDPAPAAATVVIAEPEPMQLGSVRLTATQKQQRLAEGLCFYCGRSGHLVAKCPLKDRAHQ